MQKIKLRAYAGSDGILKLALPVEWTDEELEITVTVKSVNQKQPIAESFQIQMLEKLGFNLMSK